MKKRILSFKKKSSTKKTQKIVKINYEQPSKKRTASKKGNKTLKITTRTVSKTTTKTTQKTDVQDKRRRRRVNLDCEENMDDIMAHFNEEQDQRFYEEARTMIFKNFKGYTFSEISDSQLITFKQLLHALKQKYQVSQVDQNKLRDYFCSIKRTMKRRGEEMYNHLPIPGLLEFSVIQPIGSYTMNEIPIYRESDLPFFNDLQQLLRGQNFTISEEEQDMKTPLEEVVDGRAVNAFNSEQFIKLIDKNVDFTDQLCTDTFEGEERPYTFSWPLVCKFAQQQGMPPFSLLVYAQMLKHSKMVYSSNEMPPIFSTSKWRDIVDQRFPGMDLGFTCPFTDTLFNCHPDTLNLRTQMSLVEGIMGHYDFHPNFGGSYALFIDAAIQDTYRKTKFEVTVLNTDPTQIQLLEKTLFQKYEDESRYYAQLSTRMPDIVQQPDIPEQDEIQRPAMLHQRRVSAPHDFQIINPFSRLVGHSDDYQYDADIDQLVDISTFQLQQAMIQCDHLECYSTTSSSE